MSLSMEMDAHEYGSDKAVVGMRDVTFALRSKILFLCVHHKKPQCEVKNWQTRV